MGELHIKNHFVAGCYLKGWEDQNNQIHVYRLLVSHNNVPTWEKKHRAAIAYQKHLYTQVIAGDESDALEKWLDKEFEAPATPVLEKVVLDKKLTPDDWSVLINFLAAQDVRTPSRLYEHLEIDRKLLSEALESTLYKLKEGIENNSISDINEPRTHDHNLPSIPLKISTEHLPDDQHTVITCIPAPNVTRLVAQPPSPHKVRFAA